MALSNPSIAGERKADGEAQLEVRAADKKHTHSYTHKHKQYSHFPPSCVLQLGQKLFTATVTLLSSGQLNSNEDMSKLLSTVENAIMFIGPQLKDNSTKIETTKTGNSVRKLSRDLHTALSKVVIVQAFSMDDDRCRVEYTRERKIMSYLFE